MKKMLSLFLLILVFGSMVSACGADTATPTPDPSQPMLARDIALSYSGEFQVQFAGQKTWGYQLKTRKLPALREISLHLEGIQGVQNPGDVRLVTDNAVTRMIGPGTDQQCVQFPNGQGMDPTFIYPESLVTVSKIKTAFKPQPDEMLAGVSVLHFRASGVSSAPWRDAVIDLWQEKGTGMLRAFSMNATGEDPFFGAGVGKLTAVYNAGPPGNEVIEAVKGCEIGAPLPEAISRLVRLPGMASFESKRSVEELVKFYQVSMPGQGWAEKDPPEQSKNVTILSYQRGAEGVEVQIGPNSSGGSLVKLMFMQGK